MVESWTRSRSSETREVKNHDMDVKEEDKGEMLSPRTVLNGGEREQEHAKAREVFSG